jgi:hypothetical protein
MHIRRSDFQPEIGPFVLALLQHVDPEDYTKADKFAIDGEI